MQEKCVYCGEVAGMGKGSHLRQAARGEPFMWQCEGNQLSAAGSWAKALRRALIRGRVRLALVVLMWRF